MKRLLILLWFTPVLGWGQYNSMHFVVTPPLTIAPACAYTDEYCAVLDAMTTDPTGDTLTWQNALVYSIDTCIGWENAELLYVFATTTNDDGEAEINWITPGTNDLTESGAGALVFNHKQGIAADGTNYYDTGFNPSTDASTITQNNASIVIYTRVNAKTSDWFVGGTDGSVDFQLSTRWSADVVNGAINSGSNVTYGSVLDGTGFWALTRAASNSHTIYHNGGAGTSEADASNGVANIDLYIFQSNGDAGICAANQELSIVLVCDALTEAKAASLNTIFETYMDALGEGVQ